MTAGYEGFTGGSWQELGATAPKTGEYTTLLFRKYGIYGVGLSLLAIAIEAKGLRPPRCYQQRCSTCGCHERLGWDSFPGDTITNHA